MLFLKHNLNYFFSDFISHVVVEFIIAQNKVFLLHSAISI